MTSLNQMLVNKPGPPGGISQKGVVGLVHSIYMSMRSGSECPWNCRIISFQRRRVQTEKRCKGVSSYFLHLSFLYFLSSSSTRSSSWASIVDPIKVVSLSLSARSSV